MSNAVADAPHRLQQRRAGSGRSRSSRAAGARAPSPSTGRRRSSPRPSLSSSSRLNAWRGCFTRNASRSNSRTVSVEQPAVHQRDAGRRVDVERARDRARDSGANSVERCAAAPTAPAAPARAARTAWSGSRRRRPRSPRMRSSSLPSAVSRMIGVALRGRMRRHASMPSMPGSIRSSTMRSGEIRASASMAAKPSRDPVHDEAGRAQVLRDDLGDRRVVVHDEHPAIDEVLVAQRARGFGDHALRLRPATGGRTGRRRHLSAFRKTSPATARRAAPSVGAWPTVDLVLPCLNEAAALPWVLGAGAARATARSSSTTAPTDGSAEVARAAGATVVIEDRGGDSARPWPRASRPRRLPIVAICDADASLDPAELPRLVGAARRGRRPRARPACPDARAPPGRCTPGSPTVPLRAHRAESTGVRADDLGPMRVARTVDAAGARPPRPAQRVPARDGAAGGRGGLAHRRDRRRRTRPRVGRSKVTGTVRGTVTAIHDMSRILAEMRAMSALVVIAKECVPGRVKTRLHPPLTLEAGRGDRRGQPRRHARRRRRVPADRRILYFDGDRGRLAVAPASRSCRSSAGTLDERLARALRPSRRAHPADRHGHAAAASPPTSRLARRTPTPSIGLAADGGFWALGMREPARRRHPRRADVASDTGEPAARRARSTRVSPSSCCDTLRDVDLAEDARRGGRPRIPHSRFAARWPPIRRQPRASGMSTLRRVRRRRRRAVRTAPAAAARRRRSRCAGSDDPTTAACSSTSADWSAPANAVDLAVLGGLDGPLLDIGCGPGRMVRAAEELGLRCAGHRHLRRRGGASPRRTASPVLQPIGLRPAAARGRLGDGRCSWTATSASAVTPRALLPAAPS